MGVNRTENIEPERTASVARDPISEEFCRTDDDVWTHWGRNACFPFLYVAQQHLEAFPMFPRNPARRSIAKAKVSKRSFDSAEGLLFFLSDCSSEQRVASLCGVAAPHFSANPAVFPWEA